MNYVPLPEFDADANNLESDNFDNESMCSYISEAESIHTNWRGWKKTASNFNSYSKTRNDKKNTLLELCAQKVARHVAFEQVEKMFFPVPENVVLRIAYWSFPDKEEDISLYSILANGNPDEFQKGENLIRMKCVTNVLQIGFHLSATVRSLHFANQIIETVYSVAVSFDRCKITSCTCNCPSKASWCCHIIALCLYRIHQPSETRLRSPVSESLSRLSREQLQKFSQYLISELPQHILPTAQRILDDLLISLHTEINTLPGAPDPTAGPGVHDNCLWYLDDEALTDKVKKTLIKFSGPTPVVFSDVQYMSNTEPPAVAEYSSLLRPLRAKEPEGIWNLLSIVREMLKRRDSNSVPLLDIVTHQCLSVDQVAWWWYNTKTSPAYLESGIATNHPSNHPNNHRSDLNGNRSNHVSSGIAQFAAASMLDEIVALWRLVVLDPCVCRNLQQDLKLRLEGFHSNTLNHIKNARYRESHLNFFRGFKPAIEACSFSWKKTSSSFRLQSQFDADKDEQKSEDEDQIKRRSEYAQKRLKDEEKEELLKDKISSSEKDSSSKEDKSSSSEDSESCSNKDLSRNFRSLSSTDSSCVEETKEKNDKFRFKIRSNKSNKVKEADVVDSGYKKELDSLFTRTESLYAHGYCDEACKLAVRLAQELLENQENFSYPKTTSIPKPSEKKDWIRTVTPRALIFLQRVLLLCYVLEEYEQHSPLAFFIGLQGLALKRPPAISKALEVRLLHQQSEIAILMKRLPLSIKEAKILRQEAMRISIIDPQIEVYHILPILLVDFIFDSFCAQPHFIFEKGKELEGLSYIEECSEFALSASLNALRFKVKVSEADHPLLCEGTRRLKGDFVLKMLELYKDDRRVLRMVLDSILDKTLTPNLRSTSAFPACCSNLTTGGSSQVKDVVQQPPTSTTTPTIRPSSIDSSDEDNRVRKTVCSPSRRDSSKSWRSPTVRAKRKLHCVANVNSSASEEAMLSDTSPRLRRRNLVVGVPSTSANLFQQAAGNWAATSSRYPSSPSSESGSSTSAESVNQRDKKLETSTSVPHTSQSPSRPTTSSNLPSSSTPRYLRRGNYRGRNCLSVPDQPNQPSEAAAYFFFELAKNVLIKAGGNSSTSLFNHQSHGSDQSGVNGNLVLAAFEIGLFSLGLSNCVTPNWMSRTYSSHVSWITGQAMEIGGAAIEILIDSWEGHLTAPEISALADRASHGRDAATVRRAAELALTILPHASALNLNEIHRALNQCKEQGPSMLEKACQALEQAGKGGGVFPEVLFDVAQMWEFIHLKVKEAGEPISVEPVSPPSLKPPSNQFPLQQHQLPVGGVMIPSGMITIQPNLAAVGHCPTTSVFPAAFPASILEHPMGLRSYPYAAVHIHPGGGTTVNLLPLYPPHPQYQPPPSAPFIPTDPLASVRHHPPPTRPPLHPNIISMSPPQPISYQLQKAFKVGMLALELLAKKTEDRPNNKYVRNPPYATNVKWVLKLSKKLGVSYVQQFCMTVVGGVSSPFVLQDIAMETAQFFTEKNNQPVIINLRLPFVVPIITRCVQMFVHFINNRLYHIHSSNDHDDFVALVKASRGAFFMNQNGQIQFNEILQTINRSKACKKDLWQKLNAALASM